MVAVTEAGGRIGYLSPWVGAGDGAVSDTYRAQCRAVYTVHTQCTVHRHTVYSSVQTPDIQ